MKSTIRCLSVILAVWVAGGSALAAGQAEVMEGSRVMDEVVVTATKTKNSVKKTASNVSVITRAEIQAVDAKNLSDVLERVPGVFVSNSSGLRPKVSLRGTKIGMSQGALVLMNGIPISMGKYGYAELNAVPLEVVERIEVVKGPVSSLYGGDAARGVINIISRRGEEGLSGCLGVTMGDFHDSGHTDHIYTGSVNGSTEKSDYMLTVKQSDEDGVMDETGLESLVFTADAGWWLTDSTRLGLLVNVEDTERTDPKTSLTREQLEEDRRQTRELAFSDTTDVIGGLSLDVETAAWKVQTSLYYKEREKSYENYLKATSKRSKPYCEDQDEEVWGVKNMVSHESAPAGMRNRLTAGFDLEQDKFEFHTMKSAKSEPNLPYTVEDPKGSGTYTRRLAGVFLQDEFSPFESLTLTAGIRYDMFRFHNESDYDVSQGGSVDFNDRPEFEKANPRVGINFSPTRSFSVYANYSNAYRPPSAYDFFSNIKYANKNPNELKPEDFTQYEAGFRYALASWLNLDVAVYHMNIEDMLESYYYAPGKSAGKHNVGEVEIDGVETRVTGDFGKRVRYAVAHTWTSGEYGDNTQARNEDGDVVSISGNELSGVPDHQVSCDLFAALMRRGHHRLDWQLGYQWQSRYEIDKINSGTYASYGTYDTKLRYRYRQMEIFAAVGNLFDKEYESYTSISKGKETFYPAAGRTFSSGVALRF